ncbi:MAG: aldehyde dehydrogenase, partial [Leptolyngbyaceae bacterium]|nr:aldehyde dehydrogenase [Leptolyngbyaceae bacterium]
MTDLTASDPIQHVLYQQRQFFSTGKTKPLQFRLEQLQVLKQAIQQNQGAITKALKADLNKPEFEAYGLEIGVLEEVNYALKHLKSWVKPRKISTPMVVFPGTAKICPEPLGVVLIIAPWNYPFQLMISPLVGAIAAGNCAILKPSELTPHTSKVIAELIQKNFEPGFVTVVEGGVETSQKLLEEKFDHIFFTGGTEIGKVVMAAAAKHLTPVTLELGGKSPCIVDVDIPLTETAKRIVWGKFINAGQTCIAPDYLLVNKRIKPALLESIKTLIQEFYGDDPSLSPDYARIVSPRHFQRLSQLLQSGEVVIGGQTNAADCYIAPTVLDRVTWSDPVMQSEIFGPILPVIEYEALEEAIALINARPKPLALYLFSNNPQHHKTVLQSTSSGGVCINDTVLQVGVSGLPFGGVGDSGIGNYHGKASFDTFSHQKSVLSRPFRFDLNWRYAP